MKTIRYASLQRKVCRRNAFGICSRGGHKKEARQIQELVEDALPQQLNARSNYKGREHVVTAYLEGTERFSSLNEN
jgi:hypothetical protein